MRLSSPEISTTLFHRGDGKMVLLTVRQDLKIGGRGRFDFSFCFARIFDAVRFLDRDDTHNITKQPYFLPYSL
jgi:hypothetical protein